MLPAPVPVPCFLRHLVRDPARGPAPSYDSQCPRPAQRLDAPSSRLGFPPRPRKGPRSSCLPWRPTRSQYKLSWRTRIQDPGRFFPAHCQDSSLPMPPCLRPFKRQSTHSRGCAGTTAEDGHHEDSNTFNRTPSPSQRGRQHQKDADPGTPRVWIPGQLAPPPLASPAPPGRQPLLLHTQQ